MADDTTRPARIATSLIFLTTGILHFTHEKFFTSIVPKSLPNPKALVQISGVAELAGAVGVLLPSTRKLAGKGLIALLIAVYPANIQMAVNSENYKQIPAWALWARLPLQFAAMALVWRGSQRPAA